MPALSTVFVAVGAFASTNVDDLFLLAAYFAVPGYRPGAVILGQFMGIGTLTLASAVAAFAALTLPEGLVALLGIVPLGLGIQRLLHLREKLPLDREPLRIHTKSDPGGSALHQSLAVAGVTIANGGDNLGVYIPLFARQADQVS